MQINQGECATVHWEVQRVQAVWVYPQGSHFNSAVRFSINANQLEIRTHGDQLAIVATSAP